MKVLRDFIGDHGDALRVRILVPFKLVRGPGELDESLRCRGIDQVSCLYCDHTQTQITRISTPATNHGPCGYLDRPPPRALPRPLRAVSTRDLDTTPPASLDTLRSWDRVLSPQAVLLQPLAGFFHSWPASGRETLDLPRSRPPALRVQLPFRQLLPAATRALSAQTVRPSYAPRVWRCNWRAGCRLGACRTPA